MELPEACDILESLAKGIDPDTGEKLSDESLYNHRGVIRALYSAVLALRPAMAGGRAKGELPTNAGKPWSTAEDSRLLAAYRAGSKFNDLAEQHQRTLGAIQSRLLRLGAFVPGRAEPPNIERQRTLPAAMPFRDGENRSGGPVR